MFESPGGLRARWWLLLIPLLVAILLAWLVAASPLAGSEKANYLFVLLIGGTVGATELMSRYRDAPFEPLLSYPGFFYILLNGGAAILAYYLLGKLAGPLNPNADKAAIYRVLVAGLGAMAVFRSGLFTLRMGNSDVPVGPNLILQVLLQALDRTYDRIRAKPRSEAASRIMAGVEFEAAKEALPSFCFNLMQNVSQSERVAVGAEVKALGESPMSSEAKTLNLSLTLLNVVGDRTLEAAVVALGGSIRGTKGLSIEVLALLAKMAPEKIVEILPRLVRAMNPPQSRKIDQAELDEITGLNLPPENKAVIMTHVLVRYYGEKTVMAALIGMQPFAAPAPPTPVPPPPPPPPPPTPSTTESGQASKSSATQGTG